MTTVVKVRETIPRKIVEKVPDDVLQADLRKYRERALEIGATDAKIITTSMVLIDERVLGRCTNPHAPTTEITSTAHRTQQSLG